MANDSTPARAAGVECWAGATVKEISVAKIVVVTLRRDDNVITAERDDHIENPTVISLPILGRFLNAVNSYSVEK